MHRLTSTLRSRPTILPGAVLALIAYGQAFAVVAPPPLPPGSNLVRVEGGMDRAERKRQERAHHHKLHHKKDLTRDDSVYGEPSREDAGTGQEDRNSKPPKGGK